MEITMFGSLSLSIDNVTLSFGIRVVVFFFFSRIASSFNVIATENVIYANTPSTQSRT